MINIQQLRELVIIPTLKDLIMFSDDAVELMCFTCAVESGGGKYLKQQNGKALGIYQMEPTTYNDIWQNYIQKNEPLKLILLYNFDAPRMPSEDRLIYDLRFASAMTRIHYSRFKETLPKANDLLAIWHYYKKYYNTSLGKADYEQAINLYNLFLFS